MSELVRPWLRRALLEYGQHQTTFERDLEGKYCQITRWLNSRDMDELAWAEVSDSDVIISVQFSPQSARLFEEKWKRRLSEDTRWGVITLLSFRPNFSRVPAFGGEEYLNLRVEDFRWEGSEDEACFGNPRAISNYDEFATWIREWNTGRRDKIQEKLLKFPLPQKYMNKPLASRNNPRSIGIPGARPKTKTAGQSAESGRQKSKKSETGEQAVAKLESQLWGKVPLSPFPKDVLFSIANNSTLSIVPAVRPVDPAPAPFSVLSPLHRPNTHQGPIVPRPRDTEDWFLSSPVLSQEAGPSTPKDAALLQVSQAVHPPPSESHITDHHTPRRITPNPLDRTTMAGPPSSIPHATISSPSAAGVSRHAALITDSETLEPNDSPEDRALFSGEPPSILSMTSPPREVPPKLPDLSTVSQASDPRDIDPGYSCEVDDDEEFLVEWVPTQIDPEAIGSRWEVLDSNVLGKDTHVSGDDDVFMGASLGFNDPTRASPPIARLEDSDDNEDGAEDDVAGDDHDKIVRHRSQSLDVEGNLRIENDLPDLRLSSIIPPSAQPLTVKARNAFPPPKKPPTPTSDVWTSIPRSALAVPIEREPVILVPNSDPSSGSLSQSLSYGIHSQSMSQSQTRSQLLETPEINGHSMMTLEEAKAHDPVSSPPIPKPPLDTSPVGPPNIESPANLKVDISNPPEILNRMPDSSGPGHGECLEDDEPRNNGTDGGETKRSGAPLMNQQTEFGAMSTPNHDLGAIQIKAETSIHEQHSRLLTRAQSNSSRLKSSGTVQSVGPLALIVRDNPIRSTTKGASSEASAKILADSTQDHLVKLRTSPTHRLKPPKNPGSPVFRNSSTGRRADTKKIHPLEFRSPSPATDVFGPLAPLPKSSAVSRITGTGRPSLFAAAKQNVSSYKNRMPNPVSRATAMSPRTPDNKASSSRLFVSSPVSPHVHEEGRKEHGTRLQSTSGVQICAPEAITICSRDGGSTSTRPRSKGDGRTEPDILVEPENAHSNKDGDTIVLPREDSAAAAEDKQSRTHRKRRREASPGSAGNGRVRKQFKTSSGFTTLKSTNSTNGTSVFAVTQAKARFPAPVPRTSNVSPRPDSVPIMDFLQLSTTSKQKKARTSANLSRHSDAEFSSSPAPVSGPLRSSIQHTRKPSAPKPSRGGQVNGTASRLDPSRFSGQSRTTVVDRKGKGREVPSIEDAAMVDTTPDERPVGRPIIPEEVDRSYPPPAAYPSRLMGWVDCWKIVTRVRDIRATPRVS